MRGKLISVEGTDCSGKETQTNLLLERLNKENFPTIKMQCPFYDSPTGKIIAGPYLGKENYCESYFEEGAVKVDNKVSSLYYAADRLYNIPKVNSALENHNVVLDRYVDSNKIHQCSKILDKELRAKQYDFIDTLEFDLLGLPRPDIKIMLFMPMEYREQLFKNRTERPDGLEGNVEYQKNCQKTCLEVVERDGYKLINCVKDGKIRTIEDIHAELYEYVVDQLKK